MKVILLKKLNNLGDIAEQISVKSGYARNFLIPFKKAVPANKENIKYFESYKINLKTKLKKIKSIAQNKIDKINKLDSIIIDKNKIGKDGKLFGSIGTRDISKYLSKIGIDINKKEIRLPNGLLRTIGEHKINIQINGIRTDLIVILKE